MSVEQTEEALLFLRTGLAGSAPAGFISGLASRFNAEVINPGEIRTQLRTIGVPEEHISKDLPRETEHRIKTTIQIGTSVVNEGYVNGQAMRNRYRQLIREVGGVSVVLMQIDTDMTTIQQRLEARYPSEVVTSKLKFIRTKQEPTLVLPSSTGEEHVRINGALGPAVMIGIVEHHLVKRGLRPPLER